MATCNQSSNTVAEGPTRTVSFNGESDLVLRRVSDENVREEAQLLLSVATIAASEYRSGGPSILWGNDDVSSVPHLPVIPESTPLDGPRVTKSASWIMKPRLGPIAGLVTKVNSDGGSSSEDSSSASSGEVDHTTDCFDWTRARSVSMDLSTDHSSIPESPTPRNERSFDCVNIVSPMNSPRSIRVPARKFRRQAQKAKREYKAEAGVPTSNLCCDSSEGKRLLKSPVPQGKAIKKILRRKFSWKNYPELEAFLIANREEYLRHSALNYTVQQKQYNNRLTEQLLELAAENGYVFDESEFSFVTVRDRIRCYFKSYVQSSKKRGVIIGYAARKAGLLSADDLEKSAGTAGRIVLPS